MFFTAAKDPDWTSYAHNNPFDSAIEICQAAPRFGWPLVPIERQVCTMALAQYHNYPGALEKIADRLKLPLRKDKEGKKLMRRLTRPQRRPDGTWGFIEPTPEEWEDFIEYAGIDTLLVRDVRHAFKPLPEIERRLYPLDHKINHHGPTIDVALATQCCELVKVERAAINSRPHSGRRSHAIWQPIVQRNAWWSFRRSRIFDSSLRSLDRYRDGCDFVGFRDARR